MSPPNSDKTRSEGKTFIIGLTSCVIVPRWHFRRGRAEQAKRAPRKFLHRAAEISNRLAIFRWDNSSIVRTPMISRR